MTENFKKIRNLLPQNVTLVAVTKNRKIEQIQALYQEGQRDFGENRIQEWQQKNDYLPPDIRWHLIGHLQTNKVKFAVGNFFLIQSVDSEKLLNELEYQAAKKNVIQSILLQVYIAEENTKFGFSFSDLLQLLETKPPESWPHLKMCGLMGMATNTTNWDKVRSEFKSLADFFRRLKAEFFSNTSDFKEISMGMSSDWQIAIQEGSTIVRIGSALF